MLQERTPHAWTKSLLQSVTFCLHWKIPMPNPEIQEQLKAANRVFSDLRMQFIQTKEPYPERLTGYIAQVSNHLKRRSCRKAVSLRNRIVWNSDLFRSYSLKTKVDKTMILPFQQQMAFCPWTISTFPPSVVPREHRRQHRFCQRHCLQGLMTSSFLLLESEPSPWIREVGGSDSSCHFKMETMNIDGLGIPTCISMCSRYSRVPSLLALTMVSAQTSMAVKRGNLLSIPLQHRWHLHVCCHI